MQVPFVGLLIRNDVAVTAPVSLVLPIARAHRPTTIALLVAALTCVQVVVPVVVTVTLVAADPRRRAGCCRPRRWPR